MSMMQERRNEEREEEKGNGTLTVSPGPLPFIPLLPLSFRPFSLLRSVETMGLIDALIGSVHLQHVTKFILC